MLARSFVQCFLIRRLQKYGSGRTKTSALVASDDSNYIANQMRHKPFSVATDGSNDMDNTKLYPVT
jgi:hypothetical protein